MIAIRAPTAAAGARAICLIALTIPPPARPPTVPTMESAVPGRANRSIPWSDNLGVTWIRTGFDWNVIETADDLLRSVRSVAAGQHVLSDDQQGNQRISQL